ncbi:AAA family ATPase [Variovorax humicola]|uniref:AAA family ATPase n=1 Tax=Variovorax humicola TaxID=1769758 RepID=A0ABU8WBN6_9BURK
MAGLEFQFLGDFAVHRDGREQPLPPSRKTRALLAYLCLQPRRFRREQLSSLLWDVPDDPLGSLRWSLSKLRRLVDEPGCERLVADRTTVAIDATGVVVDVLELRALVENGLASAETPMLERAALRCRGSFLEGLEFSSFHDFHGWCMAEREHAICDRAAILSELVDRLGDVPSRALPYARALVGLFPYEEAHRSMLIRLLNAAHQASEAEEQYQLGLRMLKEAGVESSGALLAARHKPRIDAPLLRAPAPGPDFSAVAVDRRLVGREAEMAQMAQALREVEQAPRAAIVMLVGAPGIGKSRVLEATLALVRESRAFVLQAAAFESDVIRPFSFWIDALRVHGAADAVFRGAATNDRDGLFERLSQLVARESAQRPVVLLLDDAQWCDESSAAALLYIARMNRGCAVLGVLAVRDAELRDSVPLQQVRRGLVRDGLLREIALGPLPDADLARLIELQVPGADGPRLSADGSGNPLLALELARAELAGGAAGPLDELVRDRLALHGATGVEVLRWAAVLSPHIDLGMLVKVSGIDATEVAAALDLAERNAMLRSGEHGLRFAHDLIARAIYTDISPLRRQVMHRRIAEHLERDTAQDLARAADLAHHATQSADPALAARALVAAGRLSLRFFANDEAAAIARRGLQLAGSLREAERVCVEIELHDILLAARPLDPAAADEYTRLAERALEHGELAHARLGYHMAATVRWAMGHWSAAREQTLQAVRAVRGGGDKAQIVGMAETAKCLAMIERDVPQADAMLAEASKLAARNGFSHHAIAAGLGMLRFHGNRLDEAVELFDGARTMCKSAGDRIAEYQANEYLVMLHLQRGCLDDARARSGDLLALGDKLREGSEEPFARAMAGLCDYAIDDDARRLDAALADLRVADAKHRLAYVLTRAALLDCERGRAATAKRRAAEALGYAQLLERPTEMLLANAVLSHDCAARGDRHGADDYSREARRLAGHGAALWTREIVARLEAR